MNEKEISILGIPAMLIPIPRNQLRGLNADTLLRFWFYSTTFNNQDLCIIQAKKMDEYSPLKYRRATEKIEEVLNKPVAVLLDSLAYYERERLIHQGVYFIVSDKYAFLPSLIVNVQAKKKTKISTKLTPAAQYILLYYFLADGIDELTINGLQEIMPYNYLALSRAVINLEECKLCRTAKGNNGTKFIRFEGSKRELWEKAQAYLSSPVKKVLYSDSIPEGNFSVSGINALSYYSRLNPEPYETVAIWDKLFNIRNTSYNEAEGPCKIQIWKYPTTIPNQQKSSVVDKLSLYLSMKDEPDARIGKELEIIIEEMKW